MILLILVLPFSAMLFYWCHTTNSLGEEEETLVLVGSWLLALSCALTHLDVGENLGTREWYCIVFYGCLM